MAKSQFVDFRPAWADADPKVLADLEDTPSLGFLPEPPPRLPTRIILADRSRRISAQSLYDTMYATQRLLYFSAFEAVHGADRNFTPNLRTLDEPLMRLAKLHIEPFDEGSFVVPAELGEEVLQLSKNGKLREFTSRDVLRRFTNVLQGVLELGSEFLTCLGVLDAIEHLGKVLNREASGIEYLPSGFGGLEAPAQAILVNAGYVDRAAKTKLERKKPQSSPGQLEGVLTLLDVAESKLKLRLFRPEDKMIPGKFLPLLRDRFVALLGKGVRLYGTVRYQQDLPKSIDVVSVDPLSRT